MSIPPLNIQSDTATIQILEVRWKNHRCSLIKSRTCLTLLFCAVIAAGCYGIYDSHHLNSTSAKIEFAASIIGVVFLSLALCGYPETNGEFQREANVALIGLERFRTDPEFRTWLQANSPNQFINPPDIEAKHAEYLSSGAPAIEITSLA